MPIETAVPVERLDQDGFHRLDRLATGMAFDIHNRLGRYLDEEIYKANLAERLRSEGVDVSREMRIRLTLDDYRKDYFVDLLLDGCVVLEGKAASSLTSGHRGQTLNYLFLCGLNHATLLNFRPERVEHEFVSTTVNPKDRFDFRMEDRGWIQMSDHCPKLLRTFERVLAEFGTFLDPTMYRDAVTHFLGGEGNVTRRIPVAIDGKTIGHQRAHLLTDHVAFSVTAATRDSNSVFVHQKRFLRATSLKCIQWINLNRSVIELCTITR